MAEWSPGLFSFAYYFLVFPLVFCANFEFVPAGSTESNKMVLVRLQEDTEPKQQTHQVGTTSNFQKVSRMHEGKKKCGFFSATIKKHSTCDIKANHSMNRG